MTKNNSLIGIGLMVLASALLSSKDGTVKTLLGQIGPVQVLWIQFFGSFLFLALVSFPQHGWKVVLPQAPGQQFVRGALNVSAVTAFFWAIKFIPLADATAMMLFAPIVVTVLSPFFLGEKIGIVRSAAAACGFFGVLVILRPGFHGDPTGYYIGLASGILLGCYFMANRRLAGSQHFMLNITHNTLMGTLALTPFVLLLWQPVPPAFNVRLGCIIALGIVGQGMLISSFKYAPAAIVSPYSYTMLLFAALIGYFVFGTVPDAATWAGIALIVGSGLYLAHRERRLLST